MKRLIIIFLLLGFVQNAQAEDQVTLEETFQGKFLRCVFGNVPNKLKIEFFAKGKWKGLKQNLQQASLRRERNGKPPIAVRKIFRYYKDLCSQHKPIEEPVKGSIITLGGRTTLPLKVKGLLETLESDYDTVDYPQDQLRMTFGTLSKDFVESWGISFNLFCYKLLGDQNKNCADVPGVLDTRIYLQSNDVTDPMNFIGISFAATGISKVEEDLHAEKSWIHFRRIPKLVGDPIELEFHLEFTNEVTAQTEVVEGIVKGLACAPFGLHDVASVFDGEACVTPEELQKRLLAPRIRGKIRTWGS